MPKKRPPAPKPKRPDDPGFKPFAGAGVLKAVRQELADKGGQKVPVPEPRPRSSVAKRTAAEACSASTDAAPEDGFSMHRMMSGVEPLGGGPVRIPRSQASVPSGSARQVDAERAAEEAKAEAEAVREHLRDLVSHPAGARGGLHGEAFEVNDDGHRLDGRRVELRPETLRKLRHGLFPIDARFDLHGMTSAQARPALEAFLTEQRVRGERCVLVIHGKGGHSPRGVGVLRGEIGAWLSQGRASTHVAAFCSATAADGGEGAVYVLLAR